MKLRKERKINGLIHTPKLRFHLSGGLSSFTAFAQAISAFFFIISNVGKPRLSYLYVF